ncbi:MAG TPA: decarboxylating 6-phosphogluconate dehydrogenase [Candidatus Limnocylindrales bacterium]|nr:decarboxylating 6-phosphogluconate dehydrogenase [Candidatus Limnocylindrales bacterium]
MSPRSSGTTCPSCGSICRTTRTPGWLPSNAPSGSPPDRRSAAAERRRRMDLSIVGLGRMGANMARRLHENGHRVVAFNRSPEKTREIVDEGLEGAFSPDEVGTKLAPPRVVWLMVPAGAATEATMEEFAAVLQAGDTIVDGANSNFHDSKRRYALMKERGIYFVDAGISGGVWGLRNGYGVMVGGDREAVEPLEPVFRALAPEGGYIHCGPSGSGHYAKMVHNGIEYGLMQAYAEGFEILHASEYPFDLAAVAKAWMNGTVIRSWLLELTGLAFEQHGTELTDLRGWVADSGEGRWTIQEAMDRDVPAPIITLSLLARFRSRQQDSYGAKVIAALRQQFGGHTVEAASGPGSTEATTTEEVVEPVQAGQESGRATPVA